MSTVSVAFHAAFAEHVLPVLASVGFAPAKASGIRPGHVVDLAVRPLDGGRRLELLASCSDAGNDPSLRLAIVEPMPGTECTHPIALAWGRLAIDTSARELLPHESVERLQLAIEFLAGALASEAESIAERIPEIAVDVRRAAATDLWRAAEARATAIWDNRHRRGEIEHDPVPGKLVFNGEQLVYIEADGRRLMFRVPGRELDTRSPIIVSDWHKTAACARVATRLTNGSRTWVFDLRGALVTTAPACSP